MEQLADDPIAIGRAFLRDNWKYLRRDTKDWLSGSGYYDAHGTSLNSENRDYDREVEWLESEIGVLSRCVEAKLPTRSEKGAQIPGCAASDDVLEAAGSIIYLPQAQDPAFLRVALRAVKQHQLANLLTRLPPPRDQHLWTKPIVGLISLVLVLASPMFLASAIVAGARGDLYAAMLPLYGLGITFFMAQWTRNLANPEARTVDELAYDGWFRLGLLNRPWLCSGAGAAEYLKQMMREGVLVPLVALDLCEALEKRTVG